MLVSRIINGRQANSVSITEGRLERKFEGLLLDAKHALKERQVAGVHSVAAVGRRVASHQSVKPAVTLTEVQAHQVGHEQDGQQQARLHAQHSHISGQVSGQALDTAHKLQYVCMTGSCS